MNKDERKLAAAMLIFGTIGPFVRMISLPSPVIALARGGIGAACLWAWCLLRRESPGDALRRELPLLALTGACLGLNWVLLFEAYRFTTVATATMCYYMAPVMVILVSPLLCGEPLTKKKAACAAIACAGMALVSGVLEGRADGNGRGIALGLGAAALYAAVMLLSRRRTCSDLYGTVVQLGVSSLVLLPYVLLTAGDMARPGAADVALLAVLGVVHTAVAYALYFSSIRRVKAQTAALMSYIDPVFACAAALVVLGERMTWQSAAGAALVLGATFWGRK